MMIIHKLAGPVIIAVNHALGHVVINVHPVKRIRIEKICLVKLNINFYLLRISSNILIKIYYLLKRCLN